MKQANRVAAVTMLLALAAGAATERAQAADGPKKPTEAQKIEALIRVVENLKDATFVRNGAEHSAKDAADHMRRKWKSGGDDIRTARQFIEHAATKSSVSGRPYLIRFKDGREIESGKFLSEKLDEMEKGAAPDKG